MQRLGRRAGVARLMRRGAVNLDHIQTVAKARLGSPITTVDSGKMSEVRSALLFALGF